MESDLMLRNLVPEKIRSEMQEDRLYPILEEIRLENAYIEKDWVHGALMKKSLVFIVFFKKVLFC